MKTVLISIAALSILITPLAIITKVNQLNSTETTVEAKNTSKKTEVKTEAINDRKVETPNIVTAAQVKHPVIKTRNFFTPTNNSFRTLPAQEQTATFQNTLAKKDQQEIIFRQDFDAPALELSEFQAIQPINNYLNLSKTSIKEVLPEETATVIASNLAEEAVDSGVEVKLEKKVEEDLVALESINEDASIDEAIIADNFDFEIYEEQTLTLTSKRSNGELYPFAKFVIETQGGDIITQSYTNKQGEFTTAIAALDKQELFVRFTSPGLSQNRIALK